MRPQYTFQMLAPFQGGTDQGFRRYQTDRQLHRNYLSALQRLRGRVYLKDGAIRATDLDHDQRFSMHGDEDAWHLLLLDDSSEVIGCARYLVHPSTVEFADLRISECALAKDLEWTGKVRHAIESELNLARVQNLSYVEIGGWALKEEWRNTKAALEIAVGSYALARLWGGAIGSCTATARHKSASILRRLGGVGLTYLGEDIPPYEDPHYGCSMELLRFDYREIAPRFLPLVKELTGTLAKANVVVARQAEAEYARADVPMNQLAFAAAPRLFATQL